jgi:hypothetical protein
MPAGGTGIESEPLALLPEAAARNFGIGGSRPDTSPVKVVRRGPNGDRRRKKRKPSTGSPKSAPKRSRERMLIVLETLEKGGTYALAAWKAGIHPKTLAYWLRRSKAGDDGYDLVWQDIPDRFHVLCEVAIETARERLLERVLQIGLSAKYPGTEAYVTRPNWKMLQFYLAWKLPEKYGKRRKVKPHATIPCLLSANQQRSANTIRRAASKHKQSNMWRQRAGAWRIKEFH